MSAFGSMATPRATWLLLIQSSVRFPQSCVSIWSWAARDAGVSVLKTAARVTNSIIRSFMTNDAGDYQPDVARIVALGASNLTRGFHTVVSTARRTWGPSVEVFGALGHGRSYGAYSKVFVRGLPGILESGLWRELESRPRIPTRALVTDIGNDILYGYSVARILSWIEETLSRLRRIDADIVMTDLPLFNLRQLSPRKFDIFRWLLFPSCELSLEEVGRRAERVNAGVGELAGAYAATVVHLKPDWYGIDPIHIRPRLWRTAWQHILGGEKNTSSRNGSSLEGVRLYFMAPERRSLFGFEQHTPQPGIALPSGGRIWLY